MKRAHPSIRASGFYDRYTQTRSGIHPRVFFMSDELSFELCNVGITHKIHVVNIGRRKFSAGEDIVHFHITFSPGIPGNDAQGNGILLRRAALRICRKGNVHAFEAFVWLRPTQWEMMVHHFNEDDAQHARLFWEFPTHQLEVDPATLMVTGMYMTLENNQLSYDDMSPKIQPHIDMASYYIVPTFGPTRYQALPWYPLDPEDPLLEGVNVANIQQRTPVWFNLRHGMYHTSGSSAENRAAGFWVESNEQEQEAYLEQSLDEQMSKAILKRNNMRFGRIYEDDLVMIFLHNFPNAVFMEQGYVVYPWPNVPNAPPVEMKEFVEHWGASPDGVAICPQWSWAQCPTWVQNAYASHTFGKTKLDPRRVALEFKASYRSTKLPEYYIVQLYWEMMATNTVHAYLLRYKRRRQHVPGGGGTYKTVRACQCYHVWRDANDEAMFIYNVVFTIRMLQKHSNLTLAELIRKDPKQRYSKCRARCLSIAQDASKTGQTMDIPNDVLEASDTMRWEIIRNVTRVDKRLDPITHDALEGRSTNINKRAKASKTQYTIQRDGKGDPARTMALMTVEDRLRNIVSLNALNDFETNATTRATFYQLCRDQQETFRLLAKEMVSPPPPK